MTTHSPEGMDADRALRREIRQAVAEHDDAAATIARLTRERDEARAELAEVSAAYESVRGDDLDQLKKWLATATSERDEAWQAITRLQQTVVLAESDRDRLRALLKTIHEGFERQVFVRNTDADGDSGWALRLAPYLRALAEIAAELEDR